MYVRLTLDANDSGCQANASPNPRARLVIIDSVTSLLAPSLSAVSSHGHAMMTTFMQHLRRMARSYYLTFLVSVYTSHMALSDSLQIINNTSASPPHNPLSAFSSTTRKPALGPSFTFLTDCTIWLARHEDATNSEAGTTTHVAEIFKSRSTVSAHGFGGSPFFLGLSNPSDQELGVHSRFRMASYVQRHEHDSTPHDTKVKTSAAPL